MALAEFLGILAAIITVGVGLATLIMRGQQRTDARIDAMGGRIDAMGGRLSEVEKGLARVEGFLAGAGYAIRREGTSAPD